MKFFDWLFSRDRVTSPGSSFSVKVELYCPHRPESTTYSILYRLPGQVMYRRLTELFHRRWMFEPDLNWDRDFPVLIKGHEAAVEYAKALTPESIAEHNRKNDEAAAAYSEYCKEWLNKIAENNPKSTTVV